MISNQEPLQASDLGPESSDLNEASLTKQLRQKDWLQRYLGQSPKADAEHLKSFEASWPVGGQSFQSDSAATGPSLLCYALADLGLANDNENAKAQWVYLSENSLSIGEPGGLLQTFERSLIGDLEIQSARTQNSLRLKFKDESLVVLRFSQRQKKSFEDLKEIFEKNLGPHQLPTAHDSYLKALTDKVLKSHVAEGSKKYRVLLRLMQYLKPYRKELVIGVTASVGLTAMALIPSRVTGILIDKVLKPFERGALDSAGAAKIFWILSGALAASYVLRELFAWARFQWMSMLGEYVATDLRRDVYTHMQKLGLDFFGSKSTGSLVSRITSDTDRLWDFIAFGIVEVFVSGLMLLGIGAVLISMDWRLGLFMLLPIPLLLGAIYWHSQSMQRLFLRIWRKWSRMSGLASDTLSGIRVVKAFHRGGHEVRRFMNANDEVLKEAERIHHSWTRFWPALMLAIHALLLGVWVMAGPRLLGQTAPQMSVGTFVSFIIYAGLFIQPIEVIGQISRMMNRAVSSAHRVFEILDIQPSIDESSANVAIESLSGAVKFENVKFSYDGVRNVIENVNFEIKAGEMIGLVGPTGSGKSTLIQLLMRFYDPSGGKILVDGLDLRDLDLNQFRQQVGMVLQESYLFHGTILDNIRYGRPDATLQEVIAASKAAHVHDFVAKLPNAYDTWVGERGHTLSGGERQRVAIARALIQNPKVLILDEATSAVDTETERKIQSALDELVRGRTVIAIAHRLSTLQKADRLIVIKEGRIIESGTHAELLAMEAGLFRKLASLQTQTADFVTFEAAHA